MNIGVSPKLKLEENKEESSDSQSNSIDTPKFDKKT